jgi:hypothetical protein
MTEGEWMPGDPWPDGPVPSESMGTFSCTMHTRREVAKKRHLAVPFQSVGELALLLVGWCDRRGVAAETNLAGIVARCECRGIAAETNLAGILYCLRVHVLSPR